jgi:hypothetical protein
MYMTKHPERSKPVPALANLPTSRCIGCVHQTDFAFPCEQQDRQIATPWAHGRQQEIVIACAAYAPVPPPTPKQQPAVEVT